MKRKIFNLLLVFVIGCSNKTTINRTEQSFKKEEYNILLGMNHIQDKNYTKGIEVLEKVIRKDSGNIVANRELGFSYSEIGNYKKGIYHYEKVLESSPKDINSLENLAYLNYEIKNFQVAESYIKKIPEKERKSYINELLGYIYLENESLENAYTVLKKNYKLSQDYNEKYTKNYTKLLLKLGKKDELYKVLKDSYPLFKKNKNYVMLYSYYMSEIYKNNNESGKAIKRYLTESPQDKEMYFILLKTVMNENDYMNGEKIAELIKDDYRYNKEYIEIKKQIETLKRI